ncbi:KIR protein [Plasmodium coatneyi]|uniref:KIR protein n=1 Tax=Plasmodium coatneyi TaxID=208452 RepID=A0A1B1E204_9APIC|nr:KIR protein [Plasmodium coatneyi]ANQ09048.1 KIR protein [Plasmodium coatneyi]
MPDQRGKLTKEDDLDQLPSRERVSHTVKGRTVSTNCNGEQDGEDAKKQVGAYLKERDKGEYADQIVGTWCYIHENLKVTKSNYDWCYVFYYWLGDILLKYGQNPDSFSDVMDAIYPILRKSTLGNVCQIICRGIDKEIFDRRKIIYDYFMDYTLIKHQLGGGNKSCDLAYHQHLEAIKLVCPIVEGDCAPNNGHSSDQFCTWFNAEKGKGNNYCEGNQLSKLTCTPPPNHNPNQAGSSGSFSDADQSAGGSVAPAVSGGALSTVALPALAYIFYKYKPFFLNKRNHSDARRKKRSTIHHDLNTLTDDDDNTSTETYSRTNLTDTATKYSVPYTSSSSR